MTTTKQSVSGGKEEFKDSSIIEQVLMLFGAWLVGVSILVSVLYFLASLVEGAVWAIFIFPFLVLGIYDYFKQ